MKYDYFVQMAQSGFNVMRDEWMPIDGEMKYYGQTFIAHFDSEAEAEKRAAQGWTPFDD